MANVLATGSKSVPSLQQIDDQTFDRFLAAALFGFDTRSVRMLLAARLSPAASQSPSSGFDHPYLK
jgi:hypothetical protein